MAPATLDTPATPREDASSAPSHVARSLAVLRQSTRSAPSDRTHYAKAATLTPNPPKKEWDLPGIQFTARRAKKRPIESSPMGQW
jgi:hypothetical protein